MLEDAYLKKQGPCTGKHPMSKPPMKVDSQPYQVATGMLMAPTMSKVIPATGGLPPNTRSTLPGTGLYTIHIMKFTGPMATRAMGIRFAVSGIPKM